MNSRQIKYCVPCPAGILPVGQKDFEVCDSEVDKLIFLEVGLNYTIGAGRPQEFNICLKLLKAVRVTHRT